ncbi:MAG TPA: DNRLRE domain-containing protein [Thermoanaerobaculia bacterium]|nr:DNRLRE domain-containing protein [Thermoanaerobaculia bacterium]
MRRIFPALFLCLAVCCLLTSPLFAAEAPAALFELRPDVHTAGGVDLDLAALRGAPERLVLPLPDGRRVSALRTYVERAEGRLSWFGDLEDGPLAGSVSLHLDGERLSGVVRTADGASYLLAGEAGSYRLREATAHGETCGVGGLSHVSAASGHEAGGLERVTAALDTREDCLFLEKVLRIVDVMVLYPISMASQAGWVHNYAANQIAEANSIFNNGDVRVKYELAYVGPITGDQPPGPDPSDPQAPATRPVLNWLNGEVSGAVNTEVEVMARAHGADMIVVVVPPYPAQQNCGIANLPEIVGGVEKIAGGLDFNNRAFMVVELNCGLIDFTFAHELGHAWGMQHDDEGAPRNSGEVLPWAFGHLIADGGQGPKATVMGCVGNALPCFRVNHFSNPEKLVFGQPAGLHSPSPHQAYNACVANSRAVRYQSIRPRRPSRPPSLTITSPSEGGSVPVGQTFNLVASAFDPEQGNLASSVRWESDVDGFLGTGSPRPVSLSTPTTHRITAKVTDASGTEVWYSIRLDATESDPPRTWIGRPSHNELVTGDFLVRGWATDASGVTDLSFEVDGQPATLSGFVYGTPRADVCQVHSDLNDPNCPNVGFRGTLDTNAYANGTHTLTLRAVDFFGNVKIFNRTFRTSNVSTASLRPVADAWVNSQAPTQNYGSVHNLEMRSHSTGLGRHAYLKFVVDLPRPVISATLKLRRSGNDMSTCYVYWIATTSWQESTINWNNAPVDPLLSIAAPCSGAEILIDVSSIVGADGTYTIGLVTSDQPGQSVYSREALLFSPELLVTY